MVMFGKNHLSLITMNIIRWHWNKQVGGGVVRHFNIGIVKHNKIIKNIKKVDSNRNS